jgi:cytidine deaminase
LGAVNKTLLSSTLLRRNLAYTPTTHSPLTTHPTLGISHQANINTTTTMAPYFPEVFSIAEPLDVQIVCDQYDLTTEQLTSLSTLAQAAKATAYCPYSRFRVGATILHTDGSFTSGANVENAAYPVGTCAERVAFGKAVTELAAAEGANDDVTGEGKGRFQMGVFKALAVATDITPPASPCGMCRQL